MSRVSQVSVEEASPEIKAIYEGVQKKMGRIPNMFLHMGHSPAVLNAYLGMGELMRKTSFSPKMIEEIAVITAQTNKCHYCLSAHTTLAKMRGISEEDLALVRQGSSRDPKEAAILQFAKEIVEKRGQISQGSVEALKKKGLTEREIIETIFVTVMNIFTNYFNHIVDPEIDFPKPPNLP